MDTLEQRQMIEKTITHALVGLILSHGFSVTLNNGGDDNEFEKETDYKTITEGMNATDEEVISFHDVKGARLGKVWLVYGNDGYDVISDHSDNIATNNIIGAIEPMIEYIANSAFMGIHKSA